MKAPPPRARNLPIMLQYRFFFRRNPNPAEPVRPTADRHGGRFRNSGKKWDRGTSSCVPLDRTTILGIRAAPNLEPYHPRSVFIPDAPDALRPLETGRGAFSPCYSCTGHLRRSRAGNRPTPILESTMKGYNGRPALERCSNSMLNTRALDRKRGAPGHRLRDRIARVILVADGPMVRLRPPSRPRGPASSSLFKTSFMTRPMCANTTCPTVSDIANSCSTQSAGPCPPAPMASLRHASRSPFPSRQQWLRQGRILKQPRCRDRRDRSDACARETPPPCCGASIP